MLKISQIKVYNETEKFPFANVFLAGLIYSKAWIISLN